MPHDFERRSDLTNNLIARILVSVRPMTASKARSLGLKAVILDSSWEEYQSNDVDVPEAEIVSPRHLSSGTLVRTITWPDGGYHGNEGSGCLIDPTGSAEAILDSLSAGSPARKKLEEEVLSEMSAEALSGQVDGLLAICDGRHGAEMTPKELLISVLGNGHYRGDGWLFPLLCQMAIEKQKADMDALLKPVSFMFGSHLYGTAEWLTDGTAIWRADGPQPTQTEILTNRDRVDLDADRIRGFMSGILQGVQLYLQSQDPDKPGSDLILRSFGGKVTIKLSSRFLPFFKEGSSSPAKAAGNRA